MAFLSQRKIWGQVLHYTLLGSGRVKGKTYRYLGVGFSGVSIVHLRKIRYVWRSGYDRADLVHF
jgi:hypothetical protein